MQYSYSILVGYKYLKNIRDINGGRLSIPQIVERAKVQYTASDIKWEAPVVIAEYTENDIYGGHLAEVL